MKRRRKYPRGNLGPHRFSMVGKCNICGSTMVSHSVVRQKDNLVEHYRCQKTCKGSFVKESLYIEALRAAIMSLADDLVLDDLVGDTPEEHDDLTALLAEKKKALELVSKERARLTQAFMREAIELEEYEPLMAELKARHADIGAGITILENQIAATPTVEARRQSLEEIRDRGLEMLTDPDTVAACAFFRQHFTLFIQDKRVVAVKVF